MFSDIEKKKKKRTSHDTWIKFYDAIAYRVNYNDLFKNNISNFFFPFKENIKEFFLVHIKEFLDRTSIVILRCVIILFKGIKEPQYVLPQREWKNLDNKEFKISILEARIFERAIKNFTRDSQSFQRAGDKHMFL